MTIFWDIASFSLMGAVNTCEKPVNFYQTTDVGQLTSMCMETGNTWRVLKRTARARLATVSPTAQDV
jgi:hypothetical protein